MKSAGETMDILEAYDLAGLFRAAAELAGVEGCGDSGRRLCGGHMARRFMGP